MRLLELLAVALFFFGLWFMTGVICGKLENSFRKEDDDPRYPTKGENIADWVRWSVGGASGAAIYFALLVRYLETPFIVAFWWLVALGGLTVLFLVVCCICGARDEEKKREVERAEEDARYEVIRQESEERERKRQQLKEDYLWVMDEVNKEYEERTRGWQN